ncbi:ABC transporter permease [Bacteroides salyersiae]|nr:ABC transporter permease [Bacteroides salyersiae]
MKQFLSFVRKEFIHILRDPRSLLILLVMPQIMVMLPGYVIKNEVKDIRVAVLDQSHDVYTTQITERLAANDYFILKGEVKTEAEAIDYFRKGEIDLVVVFGSEFANRLVHSQDASIQILSDGSEPNQASVRVAYAQQVITGFQKELQQQMASANSVAQGKGGVTSMNIKVNSRLLFNPQQRSEVNFVPGVVGMVMLLICCMMTSIAIVREREMGTMEILLASPLPAIDIVMAKLIPYMVISLVNLTTILCIAVFIMHVPMEGSLLVYVFTAFVYIFTSLMLGLLISTCVNTQLAAMLISLLLIVPTIYLSGMVFAIESMPVPAQIISNIVPTKWFISASRKIMIEGVEFRYVIKEIIALVIEGLIFLLLSWKLFKTRLE